MMYAFVGSPVRWHQAILPTSCTWRRIPVTAKKRGFERRGKPKQGRDNRPSGFGTAAEAPARPVVPEDYVPQGPTLRAEYEMRGLIEPEVNVADAGALPQIVADRMLRRMLVFGGVPLGLLFVFFTTYFVLTYKFEVRIIPPVVAYSTLSLIGAAAAGISYGIFSSSWDVDEEGSKLGFEEAKVNFMRARDGLMRQRRNEAQLDEIDRIDELTEKMRQEEAGEKGE